MKARDYVEEVAALEGIKAGALSSKWHLVFHLYNGRVYLPRFKLPHHVLGWETGCECLRVFTRNPGLRRIYKAYAEGGSRFLIIESGRSVKAVTPRSMFFHLMGRVTCTSAIVLSLLRQGEKCVPYMSTVKRVIEAMEERFTGAVPLCYKGKTRYIATATGIAEYLARGGKLSARLYSIKEFLHEPHIYTSVAELISGLRRASFGIYAPEKGEEVFVSEHSLYEASRRLLTEGIR